MGLDKEEQKRWSDPMIHKQAPKWKHMW